MVHAPTWKNTFKGKYGINSFGTGVSPLIPQSSTGRGELGRLLNRPFIPRQPMSDFQRLIDQNVRSGRITGSYPQLVSSRVPKIRGSLGTYWNNARMDRFSGRTGGIMRGGAMRAAQAARFGGNALAAVLNATLRELIDEIIDDALSALDGVSVAETIISTNTIQIDGQLYPIRDRGQDGSYWVNGYRFNDLPADGLFEKASELWFTDNYSQVLPNIESEQELYLDHEKFSENISTVFPTTIIPPFSALPQPHRSTVRIERETTPAKAKERLTFPQPALEWNAEPGTTVTMVSPRPSTAGGRNRTPPPPIIRTTTVSGRAPRHRKAFIVSPAMTALVGALNWSSELLEAWNIIRANAGIPAWWDNRRAFEALFYGGYWNNIDGAQLAYDLSLNTLIDHFTGPILGEVGRRTRRDLRQSHSQTII